jgi:hypothetical protein
MFALPPVLITIAADVVRVALQSVARREPEASVYENIEVVPGPFISMMLLAVYVPTGFALGSSAIGSAAAGTVGVLLQPYMALLFETSLSSALVVLPIMVFLWRNSNEDVERRVLIEEQIIQQREQLAIGPKYSVFSMDSLRRPSGWTTDLGKETPALARVQSMGEASMGRDSVSS